MADWNLEKAGVDDLFEMAAVIEQGGYDFYERLRLRAASAGVRNELASLRDQEAEHKNFFLRQLSARGKSPGNAIASGLQGILDEVFLKPLQDLFSSSGIQDNYRTLGFGLALEQKSIDFYNQLRSVVEEARKSDIDRILAEEENHRKRLMLMRSYY